MLLYVAQLSKGRAALAWLFLVLSTVASWWLGTDHDVLGGPTAGTIAVLIIAFVKIWMVTSVFMESHAQSRVLGALVDAWTAGACALVVVLYLVL